MADYVNGKLKFDYNVPKELKKKIQGVNDCCLMQNEQLIQLYYGENKLQSMR